jgi:hypothetical protein
MSRARDGTSHASDRRMRPHLFSKLLFLSAGVGIAACVYQLRRASRRSEDFGLEDSTDDRDFVELSDPTARDPEPMTIPNSFDIDPADPVQGIDEVHELHVEDLEVEALSAADSEAVQEIASEEQFADETAAELDLPEDTTLDAIESAAHDTGDLYGVHTPPATDRTHPDGDASFDEGQHWLEALETDSVEMGPEAEHDLSDVVDDEDVYASPHPSDRKDTPVADRGSGGPGGI